MDVTKLFIISKKEFQQIVCAKKTKKKKKKKKKEKKMTISAKSVGYLTSERFEKIKTFEYYASKNKNLFLTELVLSLHEPTFNIFPEFEITVPLTFA